MRFLLIIIVCQLFTSCDIPGRLIIVNKTNNKVKVNLSTFPSGITEVDMSAIELTKEQPRREFYYGFGGFSEQEFEVLTESFNEVQIISATDTLKFVDKTTLKKMLPKKRTGLFKSKMKIVIK